MKWHIDSIGQLYDCGESMVVYFDPASGDTHLISDFAAYLIQQIAGQARPLKYEEILELITADIEPADLSELTPAIHNILSELADLQIVIAA
jgi:hypothetical protein